MIILQAIIGFLIAIAILVTIHEFGHYIFARKLGFKVEGFSIGFGKKLFGFKRLLPIPNSDQKDTINYQFSLIPLGGYVKILDGHSIDKNHPDYERCFQARPSHQRFLVLFAGPLFNFIFAAIIFLFLGLGGTQKLEPWIVDIEEGSLSSDAGMLINEKIIGVNDIEIFDNEDLFLSLIDAAAFSDEISVITQTEDGTENNYVIDINTFGRSLTEPGNLLPQLGLQFGPIISPVIGEVIEGGPSYQANLQPGDLILRANNAEIMNWSQWVNMVRRTTNDPLEIVIERGGEIFSTSIQPEIDLQNGMPVARVGLAVDPYALESAIERFTFIEHRNLQESILYGISRTIDMSVLTLKMLGGMLLGDVSTKNISGPISIANYAGSTLSFGFTAFLNFLAVISISLGVLNLLPIPMLDGGQITQLIIEKASGKPISDQWIIFSQKIGILFIFILMSIALFNDLNLFLL